MVLSPKFIFVEKYFLCNFLIPTSFLFQTQSVIEALNILLEDSVVCFIIEKGSGFYTRLYSGYASRNLRVYV